MPYSNIFRVSNGAFTLLFFTLLGVCCKPFTLDRLTEYKCQIAKEIYFDGTKRETGSIEYYYGEQDSLIEKILLDTMGKPLLRLISNYDTEGHLIEQLSYDDTPNPNGRLTQEWNNGKLISTSEYDGKNILLSMIEYQYDVAGYLVKKTRLTPPSTLVIYSYENNPNGKPIRIFEIEDRSKDTLYISAYKYDIQGNVIEYTRSGPHITLSIKITSTYDSEGKILERIVYQNGKEVEKTNYLYDAKGNNIETIDKNIFGVITRYSKNFDKDGYAILEWTLDSNGRPLALREFKYRCKDYPIH